MKFFDELIEGFGISFDAVRSNKMRSTLATLGIVIGVVTVTLMGAAINGLNKAFIKSISALGADVFYVSRDNWFNDSYDSWMKTQKREPIRLREAEALSEKLTLATAVAPEIDDEETVKYKTRKADGVAIVGTTEGYLQTSGV